MSSSLESGEGVSGGISLMMGSVGAIIESTISATGVSDMYERQNISYRGSSIISAGSDIYIYMLSIP